MASQCLPRGTQISRRVLWQADLGKMRKTRKVPRTPEKQGADEIPQSKIAESADTKTWEMRLVGFNVAGFSQCHAEGGATKGGRKQTQANADKRKQTQTLRRKFKQTQANASKRGPTQTNAYTPFSCGSLHPPLQSPYSGDSQSRFQGCFLSRLCSSVDPHPSRFALPRSASLLLVQAKGMADLEAGAAAMALP